jgi:hypothetical protein
MIKSAKISHIRGQLVGEIVEFSPENDSQKTYAKVISKNAGSCLRVKDNGLRSGSLLPLHTLYCPQPYGHRVLKTVSMFSIDKQSGLTKGEDIIDPDVRPDNNVERQQKAEQDRDEESQVYLQQRRPGLYPLLRIMLVH